MDAEKMDGVSLVRSTGEGVAAFTEQWAAELVQLADAADPPLLAVDLAGAVKLHPRVMAGLIQAHRKLKAHGGRLALFAVSQAMNDILQVMGLSREVSVCADLAAAVEALQTPAA